MEPSTIPNQNSELNMSEQKNKKFLFQIDAWKALMIVLVIMDHTFTHAFLHNFGSTFWERISIPMLMIIMGFNMGKSFEKKGYTTLKELYSVSYFEHKMKRYVIPFVILYLVHTIMFLFETIGLYDTLDVVYYENFFNIFIGYTPFYGPGMWFIPALMSTILIFPLLYWCYKKSPKLTLIGTFIIEFLWYMLRFYLYQGMAWNDPERLTSNFFTCQVFSMLSAVGLGLWLSTDFDFKAKRNIFIWILGFFSLGFLIYYFLFGNPQIITIGSLVIPFYLTPDYNMLFFPYSAVLFMVGMKVFPENPMGKISNLIRRISKSTYHILLTQIFYFSIVYQFFLVMYNPFDQIPDVFDATPLNYLWFYPLNVLITFSIGMLWNHLESKFYAKKDQNSKYKSIYKILLGCAVLYFIARMILIVIYFALYGP